MVAKMKNRRSSPSALGGVTHDAAPVQRLRTAKEIGAEVLEVKEALAALKGDCDRLEQELAIAQAQKAYLLEAIQNARGLIDTPIARRSAKDDWLYWGTVKSLRECVNMAHDSSALDKRLAEARKDILDVLQNRARELGEAGRFNEAHEIDLLIESIKAQEAAHADAA